jgi:hypothetical protein
VALACSFLLPIQFFTQIHLSHLNEGVDHSWMLGLSYAWQQDWIFGKDMVFTYGPLAFLSTRTYLSQNIFPLLVFDIYFMASVGYVFWETLKQHQGWKTPLLLLLMCFIYKNAMFLTLVFSLQFLALWYLIHYAQKKSIGLLMQASVLTWLIFFVKLNMAYPALVIWLLFVVYYSFKKLLNLKNLLWLMLANLLLFILSTFCLPIDLWGYLKASWHLISAYDGAVSLEVSATHTFFFSIICVCYGSFMAFLAFSSWRADSFTIVVNLAFALIAFVSFKSSYVRADLEHLKDFPFIFPPLVVCYMYVKKSILPETTFKYLTFLRLEFIVFLSWAQALYIIYLFGDTLYPIKKFITLPAYLYNMTQGHDYYQNASLRKLPKNIHQKIGKHTVDIMPWEVSTLIVNKYAYVPRPILQSYQPYHSYLDQLNAEKYASASGPERVIYTNNSIDAHYSFAYETQTKIVLLENYVATDTFNYNQEPNILFERRTPKKKRLKLLASGQSAITEQISIPLSQKHLLFKCNIDYSLLGQLRKILLKSPHLNLYITTKNGEVHHHKGAVSLLKNGILIDRYVDDVTQAFDYFRDLHSDPNQVVSTVHFSVAEPIYWQAQVQYWIYELE